MTDILLKIAAVMALLAALFFGEQYIESRGYDRRAVEDAAAIEQSKREATNKLLRLTDRAHEAEQALQDQKNTQDLKDAQHAQTNADLSRRLGAAAGAAGRLRDPHSPGCGPSGGVASGETPAATGGGATDHAQTSGLLSVPLTELLATVLREADDINTAYASCRADTLAIRVQRGAAAVSLSKE